MQVEPNGAGPPAEGEGSGLYALVIYVPEPLCTFLDDLRLELVPGGNPHAHVSVLPPRPLPVAAWAAIQEARGIVAGFAPFEVQLGGIEKFDVTDVIYISVTRGGDQLRQMHAALNRGALAFAEPFDYHPHITLAQDIPPERVEPLLDLAGRRWRENPGPRAFRADHTMFVRNTGDNWVDLAEGPLRAAPVP
ncbi:MAG TPA: 2'-5' RNA ligase family protein [Bryobacteraceae bacterium]|nr:2'-5' RNA ligase family protein [Bryobacteraceae bacterium]